MQTKIRAYLTPSRFFAFITLLLLIVASRVSPLAAQAVSQGYNTDQSLQRGMIVMLKKDDASKVEMVTSTDVERIYGIVVTASDAPATLTTNDQQHVLVATTGRYDVLVTNENGKIDVGDYVSVSSLQGIGMKALDTQQVIVGKALAGFDGKNNILSSTNITLPGNKTKTVAIGRVTIDIGVARNPIVKNVANVPGALERISESVAGHSVSPFRIYAALALGFVAAIIAVSVLYAGIRSSITAIGRNPLSRKTITKSLVQVLLTGLIIFISGLFGVYLLVKL